jgi:hypothetical protein
MDNKQWDDRAEEALNPDIHTGVGNPLDPYNDELLSEEDEKRLDDKGRLVVHGKPWSAVPTGEYLWTALWLAGHPNGDITQLVPGGRGQSNIYLGDACQDTPWSLSLGISPGKPRFNIPTVGACLEVPDDLGDDPLKQRYVIEWLVDTVHESLRDRELGHIASQAGLWEDLGDKVALAADIALGKLL